mgnify:CR=1 FL=1
MNNEQLKYQIGISLIPNVGPVTAKKVIAYVGSLEGVFKEKPSKLLKIPNVGEYLANQISKHNVLPRAEEEIQFITKHNIKVKFYLDKDFPHRLRHCPDAPLLYFYRGNADLNCRKVISIVGTRASTDYGNEICDLLITKIKERGHHAVIVSGLAHGIDVAAHRSAVKNSLPTVAVLGHGLDTIYPSVHKDIAREIVKNGALITEFPHKCRFIKNNFVRRNRIVAGLADAVIIVESAKRGGALITAEIANSYNRDVFAFPGRIDDTRSEGCNWLIKTHKANLIEKIEDLEYIMGWETAIKKPKEIQKEIFPELDPEEERIIQLLQKEHELPLDIISIKLNLQVSKVSALLLNLEFAGLIKSLPGKVFSLKKSSP